MSEASPQRLLRIGELADRARVSPRMLRHYENEGVLRASRSSAGQRLFDQDAVEQVGFIRELLDAGLPIRVIRELVDCIHEPGRLEPCAVPLLVEHLREHDARIAELTSTRASLQGLIDASTG
ncbi:DNA-binding transcriptional MerR regulator [Propionibacteriaceae bacterium ES.041]|uniref:MerR family transcriptional regulator n=1 Tax=Enemella evansiae TaxID=2016499 RepID=UPI000C006FD8|nr:MerR family transcriptional regulator [Enemella evansiae]PFG65865.1 DNA-binding transcriptional MerR regulator [Propionibacteriaceae bacterium ES.041]